MSSSDASHFSGTSFNDTLGAVLVGSLIAAVLYGFTCIQTLLYFYNYRQDRGILKSIVACLWSLDSFNFLLVSHSAYRYLVSNYGYSSPQAINNLPWSFCVYVTTRGLTDLIVRSMFTARIWKLSNGNKTLTSVIIAITATDFAIGLAITARLFKIGTLDALRQIQRILYVSEATTLTANLIVTLSLSYLLHRSRTGLTKTDSIIGTLVAYTIYTGLLTTVDSLIGFFTFALMNNLVFLCFYFSLSKLYVNCYLASLNARALLRNTAHHTEDQAPTTYPNSNVTFKSVQVGSGRPKSSGSRSRPRTGCSHSHPPVDFSCGMGQDQDAHVFITPEVKFDSDGREAWYG